MRAIWSGAITFGLVNVPVKLYSATEDHDVDLHQVHDKDGGRIRYQRRCEVCGQTVKYKHIDRAYADDEDTIVLTKQDLKSIPQERDRDISVLEFVPSDQVDPIMFERTYYLEPSGKTTKAYVLLRRTLEKTDRTAIVQFALRQKTRLAALRVRDDVIVLQTLLWPDEVREAAFPALEQRVRISAKELQLSASLVKSYSDDFKPDQFTDEYQEQLRKLIEAKRKAGDSLDTEETFGETEHEGAEVIDLMEALKQSVAKSRAAKRGSSAKRGSPAKKSTAAKGAAKKSATKNTAKKSTAKKSTAKSTTKTKATERKAS
ncbi:Ku protein [Leucobacter denitrificans]|uniref:Non-homologous end joining protein Ku n=1 Tax=Leucobacter denitrificans TaxID=683042 RepID=A0A7G9S699_9MICO|nr:Ku protein [Leucobacter denitrificans]QNN63374.1 Ku protein [Leucobacter denitrificans]